MDKATAAAADGEMLDVVDENGRPVSCASRRECHSNPALIHPAVHVFVFNGEGALLLQRRALTKDIQPGRWDTSVGGHLFPGEDPAEGARREMLEELGVLATMEFSHAYLWRSELETEFVRAYVALHAGPFRLDPGEVADARFWTFGDIARSVGRGLFTPNFEQELQWLRRDGSGAIGRLARRAGFSWPPPI